MKNLGAILISATLLILSSCRAYHSGVFIPSAVISNANFKILGQVVGTSKVKYILGVGGMSKDALIAEAKADIYQHNNFPQGVTLGNVTIDIKKSFYPFYLEKQVTITADVIDFNIQPTIIKDDVKLTEPIPKVFKEKTEKLPLIQKKGRIKSYRTDKFTIGEDVYFKYMFKIKAGKISAIFPNFDKVEIKYENKPGKTKTIEIDVSKVRKIIPTP